MLLLLEPDLLDVGLRHGPCRELANGGTMSGWDRRINKTPDKLFDDARRSPNLHAACKHPAVGPLSGSFTPLASTVSCYGLVCTSGSMFAGLQGRTIQVIEEGIEGCNAYKAKLQGCESNETPTERKRSCVPTLPSAAQGPQHRK